MKLLYAEDEPAMAEAVTDILEYHNFSVDTVYNGADALAYAREEHYDGIILDVMMPKMDGFTVLRTLREGGDRTPVLLLTAKSEVEDRIAGLDLGADDYLPKPFATGELLARVRAMLRRREDYIPDILHCGDLSLNTSNAELSCGHIQCRALLRRSDRHASEAGIQADGAADEQPGDLSLHRGYADQGMGLRDGFGYRCGMGLSLLSSQTPGRAGFRR